MNKSLRPQDSSSTYHRDGQGVPWVLVSISAVPEDHAALRRILRPISWDVWDAECCAKAFRLLSDASVQTVISDEVLPDGDWKRVLAHTHSRPRPPKLIVASRLADESLWAEVLNLGGYDLLAKPFDAEEVRRVVALTGPPTLRRIEPAHAGPRAAAA